MLRNPPSQIILTRLDIEHALLRRSQRRSLYPPRQMDYKTDGLRRDGPRMRRGPPRPRDEAIVHIHESDAPKLHLAGCISVNCNQADAEPPPLSPDNSQWPGSDGKSNRSVSPCHQKEADNGSGSSHPSPISLTPSPNRFRFSGFGPPSPPPDIGPRLTLPELDTLAGSVHEHGAVPLVEAKGTQTPERTPPNTKASSPRTETKKNDRTPIRKIIRHGRAEKQSPTLPDPTLYLESYVTRAGEIEIRESPSPTTRDRLLKATRSRKGQKLDGVIGSSPLVLQRASSGNAFSGDPFKGDPFKGAPDSTRAGPSSSPSESSARLDPRRRVPFYSPFQSIPPSAEHSQRPSRIPSNSYSAPNLLRNYDVHQSSKDQPPSGVNHPTTNMLPIMHLYPPTPNYTAPTTAMEALKRNCSSPLDVLQQAAAAVTSREASRKADSSIRSLGDQLMKSLMDALDESFPPFASLGDSMQLRPALPAPKLERQDAHGDPSAGSHRLDPHTYRRQGMMSAIATVRLDKDEEEEDEPPDLGSSAAWWKRAAAPRQLSSIPIPPMASPTMQARRTPRQLARATINISRSPGSTPNRSFLPERTPNRNSQMVQTNQNYATPSPRGFPSVRNSYYSTRTPWSAEMRRTQDYQSHHLSPPPPARDADYTSPHNHSSHQQLLDSHSPSGGSDSLIARPSIGPRLPSPMHRQRRSAFPPMAGGRRSAHPLPTTTLSNSAATTTPAVYPTRDPPETQPTMMTAQSAVPHRPHLRPVSSLQPAGPVPAPAPASPQAPRPRHRQPIPPPIPPRRNPARVRRALPAWQTEQENSDRAVNEAMREEMVRQHRQRMGTSGNAEQMDDTPPPLGRFERLGGLG